MNWNLNKIEIILRHLLGAFFKAAGPVPDKWRPFQMKRSLEEVGKTRGDAEPWMRRWQVGRKRGKKKYLS